MKISLYVIHYKFINLLEWQCERVKRFSKEDVEYIVVNNGFDEAFANEVSEVCKRLNLKEIKINHSNERILYTAIDHKKALQYCYDNHISKDDSDIKVVMDSDIIPFAPFSFLEMLGNADLAGIKMYVGGTIYIASFINIFRNSVDFSGLDLRVTYEFDSGLPLANLVSKYKTNFLKHTAPMQEKEPPYVFRNSVKENIMPYNPAYCIQIIEGSLLHYYRGTSWDSGDMTLYNSKTSFIKHFLENTKDYNIYLDENVQYDLAHMDSWLNKENYFNRLIF
jgi:hypothetical protein